MRDDLILIRKFVAERNGGRRSIGVFQCLDCSEHFEGRMERIGVMTGRCIVCANKIAGRTRSTHGMSNKNSRLHVTWANMKRRCLTPQGKEVKLYSGVKLCDEWLRFEPFMEWSLANGYTDEMTIDRIDSNGGYEPGNCRYASHSVQAANRRITEQNKSGHVGVSWDRGKWVAKVQWMGVQVHLGRHEHIDDAIKARNDYLSANDLPHLRA